MRRVRMVGVVAATLGLLAGGMGMTSEGAAPAAVPRSQPDPAPAPVADPGPLDVYTVRLDERSFGVLQAAGVDTGHLVPVAGPDGATTVEVALTDAQAQDLANQGVTADLVLVEGMTSSQRATAVAADGHTVFRPYSGTGGLQAEFEQLATDNPGIAKLVTIGRTHQGRNIVALKVTRRARTTRDGRRPAALRRRPACPRVDRPRDGPPAGPPRGRRLRPRRRAHRPGRLDRAVVRPRRQP